MIMIVQHNLTSMNANRNLGIVGTNLKKSAEKLSSGYRINRAADDAAGLAISEKMRAQVRGLQQASDNAQDGISLIQTAEGAMDQRHAILQRTRELVVKAANTGVLEETEEDDYQKIQDEIDNLQAEYNRIATDTEFNKKKLLDGSYSAQWLQIGANDGQGIEVTIEATDWQEVTVTGGG
ncbi:MAG: flagellin, partial [Lachnospiraceae bacterium]|nr:flagellin [Lachnospiraceae bacterium]